MAVFLPNGIGDYPTSDSLAYAAPLQMSGNVWYVNTFSGTDAVSPAGLNATRPLATLTQALTNAASHDIIVLLESNGSGFTTAVTINKSVTIIGTVSAGGVPTNRFYRTGGAAANLFTISAADVQLRNLQIGKTDEDTAAVATASIAVTGARFRMVGCYVPMGASDAGPALSLGSGADSAEIRNCTFASANGTSDTSLLTPPESAIKSTAAITGLRIFSTSFSGGTQGFTNFYAVDLSAAAVTRVEMEGISLLQGADMKLHASSTGWVNVELATGGSRVDW